MSSFICSPKHFNSIEKSIIELTQSNSFYFPYAFKDCLPELYSSKNFLDKDINAKVENLIDRLRELNALCVTLQYKHHYVGTLDAEIQAETVNLLTNKKERQNLPKIGLYKALQCVSYQIELEHLKELRELNEAEKLALLFLKEMINALAHDIINHLPEYENGKWEIF